MTKPIGCNDPTNKIVDLWAQDAGLIRDGEHVGAHHALGDAKTAWRERHEPDGHDYGHAFKHAANEAVTHGAAHAAEHGAALAVAGAAGVVAGTVYGAYQLYSVWAESHLKGDDLKNRTNNDAVNCALASSLAFDPRFGIAEQAKRPLGSAGTAKLMAELKGKDANLVPILQGRADEGFNAMERAYAATKAVPTAERGAAMTKWLDDNGFADRRKNDVAFQKGGEYFLWTKATAGVDAAAEAKKVHDRLPPERPFACAG
ncbi:MAG: hypothetical protein JST00_13815 [Deltaproteobacteria bacterium]|nr:hypothetical protein [Deltaproteobacteria bacterium]